MTEQAIIEKLKLKDEGTIIDLYNEYKNPFFLFIKGKVTALDNENIQDLYQEAWYAVYKNIKDGKLLELTSTLKTYLFQIGRNQALSLIKRLESRGGDKEIVDEVWEDDTHDIEDQHTKRSNILRQAIGELTETCRNIMKLFYFEDKKLDEIVYLLDDFSSKDALKTKKYKCMKRLEKLVKDKFATDKTL